MKIKDVTGEIIRAALDVHTQLGPGLLESVYAACQTHLLRQRGLEVATEVPVAIHFNGIRIDNGLRIDRLVERSVVVEVKAVERLLTLHPAQLLTYLRLSDLRVGLLLNFNVRHMRQGIKRVVNRFTPDVL